MQLMNQCSLVSLARGIGNAVQSVSSTVLLGGAMALLLVPAACADGPATPTTPKAAPIRIVATTGMVADVVRNVGGDRVQVQTLMGPGVDPHLYRATRTDIAALQAADIVVYNGLLLEGKLSDVFERLSSSGKPVFALTEHLGEKELLSKAFEPGAKAQSESDAAHHDPHVWMDPKLWMEAIEVVERKLSKHEPASQELFTKQAAAYRVELEKLDAYAQRVLQTVPEESRVLVTAHDAFGYFGRRFGYQVEGVQGVSTESEAGVKDIQRLVDLIIDRKVKAVFVETTVSDRNLAAIKAGVAAKGHALAIGGELFSDALGLADTYEGTYIGMIDHNVTTIAIALGGSAPERGLSGKLGAAKHDAQERPQPAATTPPARP